jgi:predicted MFS family arabinose efflux permease
MTSVLVVVELVGVGVGSMLSPVFAKGTKWYRVLVPMSFVMAAAMFAVAAVPYLPLFINKAVVIGALAVLGIAGGIYSIPVTSFIQVRPAPEIKGTMIASSNFADFAGILLSGVVFYVFSRLPVKPSDYFALEAIMVLAATGWMIIKLPKGTNND